MIPTDPRTGSGNADPAAQGAGKAEGTAARLLQFHRSLGEEFGPGLFDAPVLLILLELFAASSETRRLTIKSVAIASGVPQSTALRWIERLEEQGMIRRHLNPGDRRSAHVTIEPGALAALARLLGRLDATAG